MFSCYHGNLILSWPTYYDNNNVIVSSDIDNMFSCYHSNLILSWPTYYDNNNVIVSSDIDILLLNQRYHVIMRTSDC
jgi:hypothetical protein